ncbi:Flavin-dependent monooxygenase, reductase subunit HsaB [Nocardia otitidiscaviarum]|uniref:Flavin-dependent monooxygenase, reductase subunit HsaB n=1 Tax=Nocardia otitidiscaviarum TaxID=1823 RepID=A0A378YMD8_9NOCA|nr:flavin reductase family protein [Nocardia otitidiscaviarum]SUA78355.1 Flavin-dependent monooxygenase, reductase subunit HsaB [Nocardia otitidiscaviarum]
MEPALDEVPAIDAAAFKAVLGRFCSGVTVITALDDGHPVGFACQSFAALSLDPPLVSFFPARTSTTWPRIRRVGRCCVNILADHQDELCRRLGGRGPDKFAGVDWTPSANGAPRLGGALASIDCELHDEVDGGDHTVVIARVTGLTEHSDASPLVFYRAAFERLAQR